MAIPSYGSGHSFEMLCLFIHLKCYFAVDKKETNASFEMLCLFINLKCYFAVDKKDLAW